MSRATRRDPVVGAESQQGSVPYLNRPGGSLRLLAMESPWTSLPLLPPYVLEDDEPFVSAWNGGRGAERERVRLRLEVLPEPFAGQRDAPLVVLGRNPGFVDATPSECAPSERAAAIRAALSDDADGHVHHYLTEAWAGTSGARYWLRCLRQVGEHAEVSHEELARRVLAVEFHGYHSEDWAQLPVTLPSQWFGFDLVKSAIARGAVIVVTRGEKDWDVAVPGLRRYRQRFATNTPRSAVISPRNLPPGAFERVVGAVRQ